MYSTATLATVYVCPFVRQALTICLLIALFFSVCHAVYWKPKVWMGASNRNSWEEALETSHKSRGNFEVIASLKLNPVQTEYLAAALGTTLHSHALWYDGGSLVHRYQTLYWSVILEAHACPWWNAVNDVYLQPHQEWICKDESCHEAVLCFFYKHQDKTSM